MKLILCSTAVAACLVGTPTLSATFQTKPLDKGGSLLFVEGELEFGDERTFANLAVTLENAIVVFMSPGGNLKAGIEIGKAIRLKGFLTYVPDGLDCASACAIAWLGGRTRLMSNTARVGFHAAFTQANDQKVTASVGNALVGAYLNQLGMPEAAVVYITATAPDDIKWLTFSDAQRVGIEVKPFDLSGQPPGRTPGAATGATTGRDWTRHGEWIQIFSRPTRLEANQIGAEYKTRFSNTLVFRYANGWHGVVIGPFPVGEARRKRDALVASGALPSDSLITQGDKFVELAFGEAPPLAPVSREGTPLATRAVAFINEFHQAWSRDNATALGSLNTLYNDQITYYGRLASKSDVLREKRQFAERWPERSYQMQPGSISADCSAGNGECVVSGIVEWRTNSAARGATSQGSARYALRVRFDGPRTVVLSESGTVLSRKIDKQ